MNSEWTISELKEEAKQRLSGNWGTAVLVTLIYLAISILIGSFENIGSFIQFLITGPLTLGLAGFYLLLTRQQGVKLENMFDGFKNYVPSLLAYLLTTIFTLLWTLLLIIPGIIAALRYSLTYYILNDQPQMKVMDAIQLSSDMMQGYKGKLFLLLLSFIGWYVLAIITFGIGLLWVIPYVEATRAQFYENVKSNYNKAS